MVSLGFNNNIVKRFIHNPVSVAGSMVIIIMVIIAIAGYLIIPDKTPNANRQILEIAAKKPGFSTRFLMVTKNEIIDKGGFFKLMFFGEKSEYDLFPILNYSFQGTKIRIREYTDFPGEDFFYREFEIADVLYPLAKETEIRNENEMLTFISINGEVINCKLDELRRRVEKEGIIKRTFLLGTDRFGRDLLSRLILGIRVSFFVGLIAVTISIILGVSLGALAGYFKGITDNVIMWFVNVVWSVPTLLMVIALTIVIGRGYWQVFLAVGLTMWVEVARVVRGQVLSIREKDYIEAARALGFSNLRILMKHVLPNALSPVIVISAANFASAILIESGLSFLGIGVQPPVPSWGGMIKDHYGYIIVGKAYLAFIPGIAIMLLVLAFTLVGNGLRDAMDVRQEQKV